KVFRPLEAAREEAAPERAVGDEADALFAARGEYLRFNVARPERVFTLQGRDGVYSMRAPDRLGRSLRQTEVTHLPFFDEPRHRADRILNRRLRVNTVLVVEVNHLDAQTFQTRLAGRPHILRPAAHAEEAPVLAAHVA